MLSPCFSDAARVFLQNRLAVQSRLATEPSPSPLLSIANVFIEKSRPDSMDQLDDRYSDGLAITDDRCKRQCDDRR